MTMIELRILIIGLITMALLAYAAVVGTVAAVSWLRPLVERIRRRALETPATSGPAWRGGTNPILADAERRVRSRQAAWRLRC